MQRKKYDIKVGYTFGTRKVISEVFKEKGSYYHKVQCECGAIINMLRFKIDKENPTPCIKCYKKFQLDLHNTRKGKLLVKKYIGNIEGKTCMWEIHCDCGNVLYMDCTKFKRRKTMSCGCIELPKIGKKHHSWKGTGIIPKSVLTSCKHNAKKGNRQFLISIEYMSDLFLQQNGKCALSGVDLYFHTSIDKTASLDRIDSSKDYIEGNVQWVHKDINKLKTDFEEPRFIKLCCDVADNIRNKNICFDTPDNISTG